MMPYLVEKKPLSLFPGMVVGLRGTNPSGRLMNVDEMYLPSVLPPAVTPADEILKLYSYDKVTDVLHTDL
jgi:hypothetical protein